MNHRIAGAAALILLAVCAPGARADTWDQVAALQRIKGSLTPAERKLDSRLAVALHPRGLRLATGVQVSKAGATEVDVRGTVDAALLSRLRHAGAVIRDVTKTSVRADIPLATLDRVARWRGVRHVDVAAQAKTEGVTSSLTPGSKHERAQAIDRALRQAGVAGPVVSEGDKAQAADRARATHHVSGVGVKVCALSDGVDSLAAANAAGELPAVDVLPDQEGSGDEGTAMLEIIHDLAPKAALGFATAFASDASFAANIRALRSDAHCDVIVDDVLYYNESPFQDGPIARSVNAVTADGALYFGAAGNEGNTLDGTSGNFEGDFVASGRGVGKFTGVANDFAPGPAVQLYEPLSDQTGDVPVTLFWADPLGAAADDYDLYLFDAAGNVVAFSQNVQDGDDDPYEILGVPSGNPGLRLAVVKYKGAARYLQVSVPGGRFKDSGRLKAYVTPGTTRGHSAAVDAFSIAAAPAFTPLPFELETGDPPNPAGPFPNPFTAAQQPERFTSDGPRRIFFAADGTPVTPGNFSSTGGVVRPKPDYTAADGVSTSLPEPFASFFGTSAATAHAAAIAALLLSGNPGISRDDVRAAFSAGALDLAPPGVDRRSGAGVLRADLVLDETGATPQPLATAGQPTLTDVTGDHDTFLEPGETGDLTLPVTNDGDGTAAGVSVTVRAADPKVTITPRSAAYGDVPVAATRARTFQVELAADYPLGKPITTVVQVHFAGVLSPTTTSFTLKTGKPAATATTYRYAGTPQAIPDDTSTGLSLHLPVGLQGYASKVTFSIDGTECTTADGATTVGIDHTFVGDLVATLEAPGGQKVTLFARSGSGGHNLCKVVFDDAAAAPFATLGTAAAPFTGTWRPAEPLAALLVAPVHGVWTFTVADTAPADTGSVRAVSLHLTGFTTS